MSLTAKLYTQRKQRHGKKVAAKVPRAKGVRAVAMRGQGKTARRSGGSKDIDAIVYHSSKGVDDYAHRLARATPLQLVEIERQGVLGSFIKDLAKRMEIPSSRIFTMLGIPKATAEKKAAAGDRVQGRGGQAAIGMVRLLGIAQDIIANSTRA